MTRPKLAFDPIEEARRQWVQHNWPVPEAMVAATSVMRVQQLVLSHVDDALRELGLTFARYEALVLLHFSRRRALPLGKMGDRLMVHPTSVTNIIDRLEAQGLVRRMAQRGDRRTTLAQLTSEGEAVMHAATRRVAAVSFGIVGVDIAEMHQLTSLLRKIRLAAGDFADGQAADVPPYPPNGVRPSNLAVPHGEQ